MPLARARATARAFPEWSWWTPKCPNVPLPSVYRLRAISPVLVGTQSTTSTKGGGATTPKCTLYPLAKSSTWPSLRWGSISEWTSACTSSGTRNRMMSARLTASTMGMTSNPSRLALSA